jgi:hypothetical protein
MRKYSGEILTDCAKKISLRGNLKLNKKYKYEKERRREAQAKDNFPQGIS